VDNNNARENFAQPGVRHETLKRVAVALRRRGLGQQELLQALQRANYEWCHPPLPGREVAALARWAAERVSPDGGRPPRPHPEAGADPLGWLATYTGTTRSFLEGMPLRGEDGYVVFEFGPGLPEKLRRAGSKDFSWRPTGGAVPCLWPLPGPALPETVWITEGESDALVARYLGLDAYALTRGAGSALDPTQAQALYTRGARRVVLVLDADQAGQEGTRKLARALQEAGLEVLAVDWLAAGLDPLAGQRDLRDLWLRVRDAARLRAALEGAVGPVCVALRDQALSVQAKQREVAARDLQAEAKRQGGGLRYLPFLGRDGFVVRGLSHLLSGYAKVGKTTLLARVVAEWKPENVLWITEEPRQVWLQRLQHLDADLAGVVLYFGLGVTRQELLDRIAGGSESVVLIDTSKLLGIEDDCSASEVTEALVPFLEACRAREATLVVAHHNRKGGGSHGEAIAGSHAFLALFDVALEVLRDEHHAHRRVVRGYSRVAEVPELVYEKTPDGQLVALGDPGRLALEEVKGRVAAVLGEEWATLKDLASLLSDPRPSDRQVREALAALVREGVAELEPGAGRRPARWRLGAGVALLARKAPYPETQSNESRPPDPDPPPHPEAWADHEGLGRPPGPPGPGWALPDLDDLERFLDDPDPGATEEPPDWPDAWPEADLLEVVV
jgi:hypothetical protein